MNAIKSRTLIYLVMLIFNINSPARCMDIAPEAAREEVVQKAIALLENNGHIFETAYKLSMDSARTLIKTTATPLSPELIDQAKRWVGSAVDFGKDHGWPSKLRANNNFIALNFLRAAGYWLSYYSTVKSCETLLRLNYDDSTINAIYFTLNKFISEKIPEGQHAPQTQNEVIMFGEYPPIDYQGLMYGPWSEIMEKLETIRQPAVPNNPLMAKMTQPLEKEIMANDLELVSASYYLIIDQEFLDGTFDPSNGFGPTYDVAAATLVKFRDKARRQRIVTSKFMSVYKELESIVAKLPVFFDISTYVPKEKIAITEDQIEPKPLAVRNQIATTRKKKPRKTKKNTPEPIPQVEVAFEPEPVLEAILAPEEKPALVELKENITPLEPEEEVYTPTHLQYAKQKTQKKSSAPKDLKPSIYAYNRHLPEEVVKVFLNLFGNEKGDPRKKSPNAAIYATEGWGTIKKLQETLEAAEWLINKRETATGIQKEKHRSSTISFRMPNSGNAITAPILKFHNDHTIGEPVREITRHFIITNLQHFNYTEDFLIAYYKENFCGEK